MDMICPKAGSCGNFLCLHRNPHKQIILCSESCYGINAVICKEIKNCFEKVEEVDMLKPSEVIEKFDVKQDNRYATIIFLNGKFQRAEFRVSYDIYDLADWLFLKLIAETIERIIREKHGKGLL